MRGCNKHLSDCHILSGITVQFTQRTLRLHWHLKFVKEFPSTRNLPVFFRMVKLEDMKLLQEAWTSFHDGKSFQRCVWGGVLNRSWLSLAWCRKTWVNDYWPRPLMAHFHAWTMFDQIRKVFHFNHCELPICCILRLPLPKHDAAIYDLVMFNTVLSRVFLWFSYSSFLLNNKSISFLIVYFLLFIRQKNMGQLKFGQEIKTWKGAGKILYSNGLE